MCVRVSAWFCVSVWPRVLQVRVFDFNIMKSQTLAYESSEVLSFTVV